MLIADRQPRLTLQSPLNRVSLATTLTFVGSLLALVVVSVAALPLLPGWLAPQLLPLTLTVLALEARFDAVNQWAIWGGLLLDLVSPTSFGLVWLAALAAASSLQLVRRGGAVAELPWLWPVWFALTSLVSTLPAALVAGTWSAWLTSAVTTASWGVASLAVRRWVLVSRQGAA